MLTISQLAVYAGVTVRAVRHYHQVGLLPEPERDHSGYRTYDAAAVVRLIRIRTLAEAGVPLARVQELLDATPEEFAEGVAKVDAQLRAEVRRLQHNRARIARLAAGDSLALPASVVAYLDELRRHGVSERYLELERDAWIMVAARVPHLIDQWIARKRDELADPDMVWLYRRLGEALDWEVDDPRVVEIADHLERIMRRALDEAPRQELPDEFDDSFVDLMDRAMLQTSPLAERIIEILTERGWRGWTRIERVPDSPTAATPPR